MTPIKAIVAAAIAMLTLLPIAGAQASYQDDPPPPPSVGRLVPGTLKWILPPRTSAFYELDRAFADDQSLSAVGLNAPVVRSLWSAFRSGAKGLYWSRPWSLYVLIRWCERHGVHL